MSFEHCCFISYRHADGEVAAHFMEDLSRALTDELALLRDEKVFIDRDGLKGGDFFNRKVARALCRSVCMVMVFTPRYFSLKGTYCAREFKGMEDLEGERLAKLGVHREELDHGLIIPVVFRGLADLPSYVTDKRQYCDFTAHSLAVEDMRQHPDYEPKIREIADYVYQRCKEFDEAPELFDQCREYGLPKEKEILPWLKTVIPAAKEFPSL